MVEADFLRPDADHAPAVQEDDGDDHGIEHGARVDAAPALDAPEGVDAGRLRGETGHEQVGELDGVVALDFVLQRLDYGDGGVEAVAQKEVSCKAPKSKLIIYYRWSTRYRLDTLSSASISISESQLSAAATGLL